MKTTLTLLVLACSTIGLSAAEAKVGQTIPKIGPMLPGSSLPNIAGKVVLVDFWASWCAPCKASFPVLNKLQDKYGSKGLVIIGVGVDDKAEDYKTFSSKMGAKFSIAHDSGHKVAGFFNPPSMPSSYLTDRKGVIRYVHSGFKGAKTEAEYTTEIEALLAEH